MLRGSMSRRVLLNASTRESCHEAPRPTVLRSDDEWHASRSQPGGRPPDGIRPAPATLLDRVPDARKRRGRRMPIFDSEKAFLVTIVSRLCISHLQSARVRRQQSVGTRAQRRTG
jgi:hypothetical protein